MTGKNLLRDWLSLVMNHKGKEPIGEDAEALLTSFRGLKTKEIFCQKWLEIQNYSQTSINLHRGNEEGRETGCSNAIGII